MGLFRKNPKFWLLLIALIVMMISVGCSGTASSTDSGTDSTSGDSSNEPALKIGFLTDNSGVLSFYGGIMNTLGRAVVDEMNKEGIEGFSKIEVKTYDTRSDQPTAIEQITRGKTEDQMDIMWGSWVEAQIIPFTNKFASIPYVMNNTTGTKVLSNDVRWTIVPSATSWDYGVATAEFFKQNGVKTWAITGQGWGEGWLDGWAEGAKYGLKDSSDIKNVWDKEVPSDKIDWTAEINEWKKLKPDALVIPNPGAGAFSIIKQMRDAGYWPKYVIYDPMAAGDYSVVKDALGSKYLIGLISVTSADIDSQTWKDFANKSVELGYFPYGFSAELVDTLHLIKAAAEKIGPEGVKDPQKFMEALRSSSVQGALASPLGPFRDNGLMEKATVTFVQAAAGSPEWSNKVDYHWEPIFKTDVEPLSREEAEKAWPALAKRLGK